MRTGDAHQRSVTAVVAGSRRGLLRTIAALAAAGLLLPVLAAGALGEAAAQEPEPVCPRPVAPAPFSDREAIADVHLDTVDCASELGIVRGFDDGTYRPGWAVRRDQTAALLVRTLEQAGAQLPAPAGERFTDVPAGSAHDEAIHRLKAAGIARGAGGGERFAPGTRIRRDQLVSMVVRGLELAAPGTIALDQRRATRFTDVAATDVHSGNVEQAAELGLVEGLDAQTFAPAAATRRDQLATVVVRALQGLPADPVVTLTLDAERSFALVGDDVALTATLERDGDPVAGEEVSFAVDGHAPAPASGAATTTAAGQAAFAFTSTETEVVTATATATVDGEPATATVQVAFGMGSEEEAFTLTVDPGPVEELSEVTAVATITTADGAPLDGRPVTFTTTGAPASQISADSTTRADGNAHFTFVVTGAGTVSVHAQAFLNPHHDLVTRTATVEVR